MLGMRCRSETDATRAARGRGRAPAGRASQAFRINPADVLSPGGRVGRRRRDQAASGGNSARLCARLGLVSPARAGGRAMSDVNPIDRPSLADCEPNDAATESVSLTDFYADMRSHSYIFAPTRELWPASSVDARIPPMPVAGGMIPASKWLAKNRPVEQMSWCPGQPTVIKDRLISEGGWIEHPGASVFNLYR